MPHQVFQKLEFSRRQLDNSPTPGDLACDKVHIQVAYGQAQRIGRAPSPQKGAYTCDEFGERERFDEIVIGTAVQSGYAVFQSVAGREKEHGRMDSVFSNASQDLKAVASGQHHVEQDEVEFLGVHPKKCVFAGVGNHSFVSFVFKSLLQRVGNLEFIFYYENSHIRPYFTTAVRSCAGSAESVQAITISSPDATIRGTPPD